VDTLFLNIIRYITGIFIFYKWKEFIQIDPLELRRNPIAPQLCWLSDSKQNLRLPHVLPRFRLGFWNRDDARPCRAQFRVTNLSPPSPRTVYSFGDGKTAEHCTGLISATIPDFALVGTEKSEGWESRTRFAVPQAFTTRLQPPSKFYAQLYNVGLQYGDSSCPMRGPIERTKNRH